MQTVRHKMAIPLFLHKYSISNGFLGKPQKRVDIELTKSKKYFYLILSDRNESEIPTTPESDSPLSAEFPAFLKQLAQPRLR